MGDVLPPPNMLLSMPFPKFFEGLLLSQPVAVGGDVPVAAAAGLTGSCIVSVCCEVGEEGLWLSGSSCCCPSLPCPVSCFQKPHLRHRHNTTQQKACGWCECNTPQQVSNLLPHLGFCLSSDESASSLPEHMLSLSASTPLKGCRLTSDAAAAPDPPAAAVAAAVSCCVHLRLLLRDFSNKLLLSCLADCCCADVCTCPATGRAEGSCRRCVDSESMRMPP